MKKSLKYLVAVAVAGNACTADVFGEPCQVGLGFFCHLSIKSRSKLRALWGSSPKTAYKECLKDGLRKKLSNTHLYILLSSYKQAKTYGKEIVKSMEANAKNLADLGVTSHIIVRCDGEKENGKDVISGDLRTYAEILNEKKIAFKVHETEGVKPSDFEYEYHKPESAHWELIANKGNLGCSGTRHASIDAIEKEVEKLQDLGKNVYIGIFDGDDWVHEDFYPVLLLNALYTNAPVSNYNGRMGAHGLEYENLREGRLLGIGEQCTWTLYTDMESDYVDETLSKQYAELHPGYGGECCTTKIFRADYFYEKLNSLWQKKQEDNKSAKRNWIDLGNLAPLNGFCKGACTCTTTENLFHYTKH